jgi:hypothetical protein
MRLWHDMSLSFILAFLGFMLATACTSAATESLRSGREIARYLIEYADAHNGAVTLADLPVVYCMAPEGGVSPASAAVFLFPGKELSYVESEDSEGIWFIIASDKTDNKVRVFAISQNELRWSVDERLRVRDLLICPLRIFIDRYSSGEYFVVKIEE